MRDTRAGLTAATRVPSPCVLCRPPSHPLAGCRLLQVRLCFELWANPGQVEDVLRRRNLSQERQARRSPYTLTPSRMHAHAHTRDTPTAPHRRRHAPLLPGCRTAQGGTGMPRTCGWDDSRRGSPPLPHTLPPSLPTQMAECFRRARWSVKEDHMEEVRPHAIRDALHIA